LDDQAINAELELLTCGCYACIHHIDLKQLYVPTPIAEVGRNLFFPVCLSMFLCLLVSNFYIGHKLWTS